MRESIKNLTPERTVLVIGDGGNFSTIVRQFLRGKVEPASWNHGFNATRVLPAIAHLQPDVAVADMPEANSAWISLIKQIKAANPQIKVLAVCGELDPQSANRVLRAGADGYVLREDGADELSHAIHDVVAGGLYVSENILSVRPQEKQPSRSLARRSNIRFQKPGLWKSGRGKLTSTKWQRVRFRACIDK